MTRIAVFSDVHGNVPALDAVLADLETVAPDEVLVGGDLVGRGPDGTCVVERIAASGWRCVRGNHEDYMLDFRFRRVPEEWWNLPEWSAARFMSAELSDEAVAYIDALPFAVTAETDSDLRLVHGSPLSTRDGLGGWSSEETLATHLARIEGSLLVCAHTHRPMVRSVGDELVVNVGAVGLPFNGDRRAQYALFERVSEAPGARGWRVELRQVEYDIGETLARYRESGFLEAGGVTARLLALELENARSFLVPFLAWTEALGERPEPAMVDRFVTEFDPEESMSRFFSRLRELSRARSAG